MPRNTEEEGIFYHLKDTTHMQTTAHRPTSLWTTVRTQLRGSRDADAAQAALERELASYSTPEDLSDLSNVLCHRI
jgi:hypothetical protein